MIQSNRQHKVLRIVELIDDGTSRPSRLTLATTNTDWHLNIFFRDYEDDIQEYCLTPDSARILRDGLLEFYPLSNQAVQEPQEPQEPKRYEARQSMVSGKWVVERVIRGLEHVVDCANKADAIRVAGVLNDIKVW